MNLLAYYGTRILFQDRQYLNISLPVDRLIPLIPAMILIYVGAFPTWAAGLWIVAREDETTATRLLAAEQLATFVCMLFFIFMPTSMARPELGEPDSFFLRLVNLIYQVDTPDNLFPSLHCVENWIIFRALRQCKKVHKGTRAFFGIYAVLVFVSVLTVRQHLVLDVVGAIVVVELSLLAARKLNLGKLYRYLNRKLRLNR